MALHAAVAAGTGGVALRLEESLLCRVDRVVDREWTARILRTLLADGPMDGAEVTKATGFSERTLRRARKDIGVQTEARRNERGRVLGWTWSLPDGQAANTTRPMSAWPCGPSGHTQDKHTVSVPDGQASESGHLDAGAMS